MPNFFYYDNNGTKQGPYDNVQLIALARNGSITPDTLIENEAGKQTKAKNVRGLFPHWVPPPPIPPVETMPCPHCGEPVADSESFCGSCGKSVLVPAQPCPHCGTTLAVGEKFCGSCGKSVSQSSSTSDNSFTPGITTGMYNPPPPSSGGGFLDIGFTRFITPIWISVIWVIDIVMHVISFLASLVWIGRIADAMSRGGTDGGVFILGLLLASIILHLLSLLLSRILLELIIVVFKIEENTRRTAEYTRAIRRATVTSLFNS
jgi:hypothetical protein